MPGRGAAAIIQDTGWGDGSWFALCPVCGGDYTHHGRVDVYCRDGEDGPTTRTTVDGLRVETVQHADGNPSGRRDGFAVAFYGECGHTWELHVSQHKGSTFITTIRGADLADPEE